LLAAPIYAGSDFGARFEEIKKSATDEQLYRFLYDLPKGGDIHNHQDGAVWPEWWYRVATDPTKTHGDTFYTRTKILDSSAKVSPVMFYITIPKWQYDRLPESAKPEYEPLASLDAATKEKWLASLWLGDPGGRSGEILRANLAADSWYALQPIGNHRVTGRKYETFRGRRSPLH
jgi:adenosine deaminase CECR1